MFPGRDLKIYYGGELIAAVRSKGVTLLRDSIDETDGDSDTWQRINPEPDTRAISVSVAGVATAANFAQLLAAWESNTAESLVIGLSDGSSIEQEGFAILTSLSHAGETGGFVNFAATFELGGIPDYIRVPRLLNLDPDEEFEGEDGFTMTVTGRNFRPDTVVYWNGTPRATTYVNATTLLAAILEADIAAVGEATVYAEHPGAIASNELTFEILPSPDIPVIVAVGVGISARSLDYGHTWSNATTPIFVSGSNSRDDVTVAVYDSTRKTFLAFGGNGNRSMWRSTDGGDNWVETQNALPNIGGINIADGLYLEAYDAIVIVGLTNSGANARIYVSQDGGDNWTSIIPPGAPTDHNFRGIAYDPDSDEVFCIAGTDSGAETGEYHCPASEVQTQASWVYVADDLGETVTTSAGVRRGAAYFPPTGRGLVGVGESSSFQDGQCGCSQPANDYDGNWFLVSVGTINNGDCMGLEYFPPLGMMFGIWDNGVTTGTAGNIYAKSVNPHSGPWSLINEVDRNARRPRYIAETQEMLMCASGRFIYSTDLTTFTEVLHAGAWLDIAQGFFTE